ncbi:hypothetical protein [Glaciibacter superstes]|uniref:hypothetical protein n=1 Tax=Glaciibacter superstes TaxID=501023 RepID=UPI0003B34944|nr:hypothetical protein [Glaciibacter superstes]
MRALRLPSLPAQPSAPVRLHPAPLAPAPKKSKLGTTALVLGIVAVVFAVIPGLSFLAWLPALAAIGLGIATIASKSIARKGKGISGVVLGGLGFIVAIVASVSFLASLGSPSKSLVAAATDAPAKAEPAAPAAKAPATKATPKPTPTPTPVVIPVPADAVYSGTGDTVLQIAPPDGVGEPWVADVNYVGDRNFVVWSLDANMAQTDLLVNTIGAYTGSVLSAADGGSSTLEITANGDWSVVVKSLRAVPEFAGATAAGTGDFVVIYRGDPGVATITHGGSRNFVVWTYGNRNDLVVNEIGAYSGTKPWAGGPSLIEVKADGPWSITVG